MASFARWSRNWLTVLILFLHVGQPGTNTFSTFLQLRQFIYEMSEVVLVDFLLNGCKQNGFLHGSLLISWQRKRNQSIYSGPRLKATARQCPLAVPLDYLNKLDHRTILRAHLKTRLGDTRLPNPENS
jgi:hypothetical protein